MKKLKNGISLMSLVVTVVVIGIITTAIVVSFDSIYVAATKKDFANEIYNIQKLVDMYHYRNGKYPVLSSESEVSLDLSELDDEVKQQFSGETQDLSSTLTLKRLDLYETGVEETKFGHGTLENEDIYCVSEITGKVYYKRGKEFSNGVYYTLTDELKSNLGL